MFRTRNSYKRSSSTDNGQNKKTKLSTHDSELEDDDEEDDVKNDFDDNTDEDSDYKPKKEEKSSETDDSDDETESKFFKSYSKNFTKTKSSTKNLTNFVEKYKQINSSSLILSKATPKKDIKKENFGHNLESDSSSDEFERVPFSLEELGDFKKINPVVKKENNVVNSSDSSGDDVNDVNNKMKESDYFDFTQIIERQELIKSVAMMKKENDKKAEIEKRAKSSIDNTKEINKKYIRRKVNRACKKQGDKNEHSDPKSNDMNVMELLKLGEGTSKIDNEDFDHYDDNSDDDDDTEVLKNETKPKNIQVTIELPGVERKKEKKKTDIEAAIKRRFNLIKKENQIYAHKVHILCWISHGNYLNNILNSTELMGIALSLIPSKHCYPPKRCDLNYLENLVDWYIGKIKILKDDELEKIQRNKDLHKSLEEQFIKHVAYSRKDLALLFVCMVRALGLTARLIINLRPVPLKPPVHELISLANKTEQDKKKSNNKSADNNKKSKDDSKTSKKLPKVNSSKYFSNNKNNSKTEDISDKKVNKKQVKSDCFDKKKDSSNKKVNNNEKLGTSSERKTAQRKQPLRGKKNLDNINDKTLASTSKGKKIKLENCEVDFLGSDSEDNKNKIDDSDSDDFVAKSKTKQNRKSIEGKIDRRVLSTDDENDKEENRKKKKKNTVDEWAEVFLEAEEKWISVDLVRGKIHCTQHLYSAATPPVTYVLGWENNRSIKDLTRRYVPHWMTVTRKQRAEPEWWEETIRPFAPPNNARNREEDEELDKQLEDQPLPSSISEFKNHPLYALKRHLLKFQAIYPPDAPTVGFIKSEPVYSRTCVVELHTRESWIKEAKLVRVGEEPYKIVKARPKYDKMTGTVIKDLPLNLYGYWQVDDYIPPPAVDGKVPRNEYGNVELYKPCMLPAGTVHLQLPGLNRVAKKLDIDCAPAVVGWDFHSGGSHPVLDGYIVCEEFKDKLLDAWNLEIDESAKRAREKVEQRVYGNWRRIIKGLLIREKLKLRYGFEEVPEEKQSKKKQPAKKSTKK